MGSWGAGGGTINKNFIIFPNLLKFCPTLPAPRSLLSQTTGLKCSPCLACLYDLSGRSCLRQGTEAAPICSYFRETLFFFHKLDIL